MATDELFDFHDELDNEAAREAEMLEWLYSDSSGKKFLAETLKEFEEFQAEKRKRYEEEGDEMLLEVPDLPSFEDFLDDKYMTYRAEEEEAELEARGLLSFYGEIEGLQHSIWFHFERIQELEGMVLDWSRRISKTEAKVPGCEVVSKLPFGIVEHKTLREAICCCVGEGEEMTDSEKESEKSQKKVESEGEAHLKAEGESEKKAVLKGMQRDLDTLKERANQVDEEFQRLIARVRKIEGKLDC